MPKILVLYYSSYGHIEAMARARAAGGGRRPDTERNRHGKSCCGVADLRMPTALELEMCRFQGEHVARIISRLVHRAGLTSCY